MAKEQIFLKKAAMALNCSEEWVKGRHIGSEQVIVGGKRIWAVILGTRRGSPFVAVSFPDGDADTGDVALEVFGAVPLLGISIVAEKPFGGWQVFRRNFSTNQVEQVPQFTLGKTSESGEVFAGEMKALDHRFEALLFDLHSTLRDTDGLHPDEALDELCKIIGAKLLDETTGGSDRAFKPRATQSDEETAADIRRLCVDSSYGKAAEGQSVLSTAALASVSDKLAGWSFSSSPVDVRGRAFQKLLGTTFRAGLGQFFTPTPLVQLIVKAVSPQASEKIIDPFCGSGHFLSTALEWVQQSGTPPAATRRFAAERLWGIDINERMIRVAITDLRLQGDGKTTLRRANSLLLFSNLQGIKEAAYDVVLTNPPFGSVLSSNALQQIGPFELAKGNSTPLEVLGLERSIQLLKPGGRFGIVLPEGVLTNKRMEYVREWLASKVKVRAIVSLPREAFAPLGANIATCIILARKWRRTEPPTRDYNVLAIDISDVGYDAAGRPTSSQDMSEAEITLTGFLAREGW